MLKLLNMSLNVKPSLVVSPSALPDDPALRHAMLRDYFCDKDATAVRTSSGWQLNLYWPGGNDRHVDERLQEGLSWWGNGISSHTMIVGKRRNGRILETLFDTWTLHSWSQWARSRKEIDSPIILHVDDHRDLACPRLFIQGDSLYDALTGKECDIHHPESVYASIMSGAVGMGSFMTPFLHRFPDSEIRHLCQYPKVSATSDFCFSITTEPDTLLNPRMARPSIELTPVANEVACPGPGRLRVTPDLGDWLQGLESVDSRSVLLHVDMDYFNNRYDGDSDWELRNPKLDPDCSLVLEHINEFCDAIRQVGIGSKIEDVVVAYSPGFFPAELWKSASEMLCNGLAEIVKT